MISAEFTNAIINEMINNGITPPSTGIQFELGKYFRFNPETGSTQSGSKSGWYCLNKNHKDHTFLLSFGDFAGSVTKVNVFENSLKTTSVKATPQEIERRKKLAIEAEKKAFLRRQNGKRVLINIAKNSFPTPAHPYLLQKHFDLDSQSEIKVISNNFGEMLIPVRDVRTGKTINCQKIREVNLSFFDMKDAPLKREPQSNLIIDSSTTFKKKFSKMFIKGCPKEYGYHIINGKEMSNKPIRPGFDTESLVGLVEGYATGLEIHQMLGIPVIVCFDADNMKKVVKDLVQEKGADTSSLLVFADNDLYNEMTNPRLGNKGIDTAKQIKMFFNVDYVYPHLEKNDLSLVKKVSDFNDMRVELGIEYTRQVLFDQVDQIIIKNQPIRENPPEKEGYEEEGGAESSGASPSAYNYYIDHIMDK